VNTKRCLVVISIVLITTISCLDFGEDVETTTPTQEQVKWCRQEMYVQDSAKITPMGFALLGSGIDDVIWFKFATNATDLSQVFDTTVVDVSKFEESGMSADELKGIDWEWWDVKGKNLLGGQVTLPDAKFMNVGAEEVGEGYVIYVMWFET
jgi:hypothetical protein